MKKEGRDPLFYIKNSKFGNLFFRNFLLILTAILFPAWILFGGVFFYFRHTYLREVNEGAQNALAQVQVSIDANQRNIEALGKNLANNSEIRSFTAANFRDGFTFEEAQISINILSDINRMQSEYVEDISIFSSSNGYVISGTSGVMRQEYFRDTAGLQEIKEKLLDSSHYTWYRVREGLAGKNKGCISTVIRIPLFTGKTPEGFVILDMSGQWVDRTTARDTQEYQNFFILDKNGGILYNSDSGLVGEDFAEKYDLSGVHFEAGKINCIKVGEEKIFVNIIYSPNTGWYYVSFSGIDNYYSRLTDLTKFLLLALLLLTGVTVAVAYNISVQVFLPLRSIIEMIEEPREFFEMNAGNIPGNGMRSELKYITASFLTQFSEQERVKEELADYIARLKQAQLALLQTQINPHFLFNTFQTLNFMAVGLTQSENGVSQGIEMLSGMLRGMMEVERNLLRVKEECDYGKAYIGLEQLRYQNEFTVEWQVPEELNDYFIVKISLQPLLENCIRHGFPERKEDEHITVTGCLEGENLFFSVRDNGGGCDLERIRGINRELEDNNMMTGKHIGLRNVNQRIKLLFGKDYGLKIGEEKDGFAVFMKIPAVKE